MGNYCWVESKSYFEQVSFVNGINTSQGGKHVDYITNQITKKLGEWIKKRKLNIKPIIIKENLIVFIKSIIDNPSFRVKQKNCLQPIRINLVPNVKSQINLLISWQSVVL